ncbi:hypothetical protein RFI_37560, partial [Reticulomyxa filosa]
MSHGFLLIPSKAIVNDIAESEHDILFGNTCYSMFQCLGRIIGYSIVIVNWAQIFPHLQITEFAFMFCIASVPLWFCVACVMLGTPGQNERLLRQAQSALDADALRLAQSPFSLDFVPNLPLENVVPSGPHDAATTTTIASAAATITNNSNYKYNNNEHKKTTSIPEETSFELSPPKQLFSTIVALTSDLRPQIPFATSAVVNAATLGANTSTAIASSKLNNSTREFLGVKSPYQYLLRDMPLMMLRGRGDAFQYKKVADDADEVTTATEFSDANDIPIKANFIPIHSAEEEEEE